MQKRVSQGLGNGLDTVQDLRMSMQKAEPQQWLYNLTIGVSRLIDEEKAAGYSVKAVVVSAFIADKIESIIGHEPTQLCGYNLEILPEMEFEEGVDNYVDENGESYTQDDIDGYVGLRADPIC